MYHPDLLAPARPNRRTVLAHKPRSITGTLPAALIAALGIWLSRSVIGASDEDVVASRIGFLRPFWELAALALVAMLTVLRLRPRVSDVLPFYGAVLLALPWLPGPIPAAFIVWADGLVPLVWLAIAVGVMTVVLPMAAIAIKRQSWLVDGRRAPIAASLLAFVLAVSASMQVAPRIPGGDEPHYLVIAQTLLNHGHLRIEATHREEAYLAYFDGTLPPHYLRRGLDGEIYSVHAPGLPVLVAPVFAVAGYPGVWPSVRVRQRIVDALDRAGRTRQHMPVLIDLREVSTNAMLAYRDLLESFAKMSDAEPLARRAVLTRTEAGDAARSLLKLESPVRFFVDAVGAVRWLQDEH